MNIKSRILLCIFTLFLFGCDNQTSQQICVNDMLKKIEDQNHSILVLKGSNDPTKITPELIEAIGNVCKNENQIIIK